MRIDISPTIAAPVSAPSTSLSQGRAVTVDKPSPTTSSVSVSISGQTLLRQRLFFCFPDVEPPIGNFERDPYAIQPALFLDMQDRQLLGEMYEFAQSEGIDLRYVDNIGQGLADYRSSENGQRMGAHNRGNFFDLQGHMLSYSFTEIDTLAARKIRENPSMATTRLDKGFINFQTDKDYSSLSHVDFKFLDFMINRFSATSEPEAVNARFQRFEFLEKNWIEHVSKEVYDILPLRGKSTSIDPNAADKQSPAAAQGASTVDLSTTIREIVHKYLRESGLPTLFDTLMRLGK